MNIRQAKANYIINELEICRDDPKKFWRVIKSVFPGKHVKNRNKLSLVDDDGDPITQNQISNFINDYFVNIGHKISAAMGNISNIGPTPPSAIEVDELLEFLEVKEVEVYAEVKKINVKKSSGYSNINSKCLKGAFEAVIPELTKIFNLSINTAKFPSTWKTATVVPIPKVGNSKQVQNYRPISLLPLPGKILEKLIHSQIGNEFENIDFFTDRQHGFRKKRSTLHAALQLINHVNVNLDNKKPTAVVFIDFRKAFDCVDHEILVAKLARANLGPDALNWVKDYLMDRQQRVLANNILSDYLKVQQGVPQGSTLGPLFYIIYANDIPDNLESNVSLYADDTALFTSSKDSNTIITKLQADMDRLKTWCHNNRLTVNAEKTKILIFGNKKQRKKIGDIKIAFDGELIEEVNHYTYLGVKLDQTLNYDLHAKLIIQRVSDKIVYLKRVRRFINATAALNIYKNMILPILEYGDVLFLSLKGAVRKRLQTLQNKALKCALGLDPFTGSEEVHRLAKLEKLEVRREQHALHLMFKQRDNPFLWKRKKQRRAGVSTRSGNKKQFILRKFKTEKFKKCVTNRAPMMWNELPKDIQDLQNLNLFKLHLQKHLPTIEPNN